MMHGTITPTPTGMNEEEEDHGFISFPSNCSFMDDSTMSSLTNTSCSACFSIEKPTKKRARLESSNDFACATQYTSASNGVLVVKNKKVSNCEFAFQPQQPVEIPADHDHDLAPCPCNSAQHLHVPAPIPIPFLHLDMNPQCSMNLTQSMKRKRAVVCNEHCIENTNRVNNAILQETNFKDEELFFSSEKDIFHDEVRMEQTPLGYIWQTHHALSTLNGNHHRVQTSSKMNHFTVPSNARTVPNPLAHEDVPAVIQVPLSPLGLAAEAEEDEVSELGLDEQDNVNVLKDEAPESKTEAARCQCGANEVLDLLPSNFVSTLGATNIVSPSLD